MITDINTASPALQRAFARIDYECGPHALLKDRVRRAIKLGTGHAAVRARYGTRLSMLRDLEVLETSIYCVEKWLGHERRVFELASSFGGGNRLSIQILSELRLLLRLLRRDSVYNRHFGALLGLAIGSQLESAS